MSIEELVLAVLTMCGSAAGAYGGVKAGIARVEQIAKNALASGDRANNRIDAHLESHRIRS